MIVGGYEIEGCLQSGAVLIDPTERKYMNPTSWDLRLGDKVAMYVDQEVKAVSHDNLASLAECARNTVGRYMRGEPVRPSIERRIQRALTNLGLPARPTDRSSSVQYLDSKKLCTVKYFDLLESGFDVHPGNLYLFHTLERIHAPNHVTVIDGKSSIGRLGLIVHCTAGYIDPGFDGQPTLEVTSVAHVVRVYPGMRFCQIRFHTIAGLFPRYDGNYKGESARGPVPSASWRQFEPKTDS